MASRSTRNPLDDAFFLPVTRTWIVWAALDMPAMENLIRRRLVELVYRSTVAWSTPSTRTSAMPQPGQVAVTHPMCVPLKLNVAVAPVAVLLRKRPPEAALEDETVQAPT